MRSEAEIREYRDTLQRMADRSPLTAKFKPERMAIVDAVIMHLDWVLGDKLPASVVASVDDFKRQEAAEQRGA